MDNKQPLKRFNVALPQDQYDRLVNEHRFELKMDRSEFFRHVFQEYENGIKPLGHNE